MSLKGNYTNEVATAVVEAYNAGYAARESEIALLQAKIQFLEAQNLELRTYIHGTV